MDSNKLNYIERPTIIGQNNFSVYRPLGLIFPIYKIVEKIIDVRFLLEDCVNKLPGSANLYRKTYNFKELVNVLSKFVTINQLKYGIYTMFNFKIEKRMSQLRYFYVFYDVLYRNYKFNKDKSKKYKRLYSVDLVLYHSMVTFLFPVYAYKFSFDLFKILIDYPKKRNFYLNMVSMVGSFYVFLKLVQLGDLSGDIVMNNTFRKFIFDYKVDFRIIRFYL